MPKNDDNNFSIIVFSGSRAEYYIIEPLIIALSKQNNLIITLVTHHNYTTTNLKNLENKNIRIIRLPSLLSIDDPKYSSRFMHSYVISNIIKQISDLMIIEDLNFDLAIAYADRFETLGFAIATSQSGIPVLHMEAGDITNGGTPDDNVRHSITKLSHLFMTSTKKGIDLLLSFREDSWRIYHSGLLGYSSSKEHSFSDDDFSEVLKKYRLDKNFKMLIIATMHPLPFNERKSILDANEVFNALKIFTNKFNNVEIFVTSPNSDSGSEKIQKIINKISSKSIKKVNSLGLDYQKLLSLSNKKKVVLLGNSSSIIKEAPFFNCHHINVGQRQENRVSSNTQIDISADSNLIVSILEDIYLSKNIQPTLEYNPYFKKEGIDGMIKFIQDKLKIGKDKLLFKRIK